MRTITMAARRSRTPFGLATLLAGMLASLAPPAAAETFEAGAYIIPMDLDYQDDGMLRAYGLVYELLRNHVPVRWVIASGKGYGDPDFAAIAVDVGSGAPIDHQYRGGPFVVSVADANDAEPIITAWQAVYPETAVHEATMPFSGEVARYLVVAPTIAMVADGNQDIARGYMQAAGIPDSTLSLAWANDSPDMLDVDELMGPTDVDHRDGLLFDADGDPVYCQLMSMHWGVNDANANPEVVAEVREYLNNPVHFFAECQAVNAFENLDPHGYFLTPNGFLIGQRPDEVDYHHMDSPFGQLDGPWESVGGSEPAYTLPPGDSYKAGDITMVTEAGTPEGVNDVWMTGFLDGQCPPDQHECGQYGKVSYLGGHEYRTDLPMSTNPDTWGTRMFLNSLFEAPCATVEGIPLVAVAVDAPPHVNDPNVTLSVTYVNTSYTVALDAVLHDALPAGVTFVSASDGGMLVDGVVTWDLGNLGPFEGGDVTIDVTLDAYGTYDNQAELDYRVGLNDFVLTSNVSQTVYDDQVGTTGGGLDTGVDATGGEGSGSGSGVDDSGAPTTGVTSSTASGDDTGEGSGLGVSEDADGCGCRSGSSGPIGAYGWMLVPLGWLAARRRRRRLAGAATLGATLVMGSGCPGGDDAQQGDTTSTTLPPTGGATQGTVEDSADETGPKLDAAVMDLPLEPMGCQKIDFLFVIDSSESMKDYQDNLVASFPGFAAAMQEAVSAEDWHVMVVDTDGQWNGAPCANACATLGQCPDEPAFACSTPAPSLCDITIGSGMVAPAGEAASNIDCGLGSRRFIDADAPDLPGTFGCVARVGVDGSPEERTADALLRALSPELAQPDACNEGFLRDDAILVVTLITDEPDEVSEGEPMDWYDAIVTAKNGDETAVVMLGLLPDADTPMPLCNEPEGAPRLAQLLEAFPSGTRASVCEPDYSPFLTAAVDVIASTCADFEPPG
ncbi:hypothetical protein [Paraliomyxa miuraensis]|uniref:hypothetical protein n=1 Tax=Paraliomyxa miuraensis TaxID=376150 RepID=UPI0022575AD6|nr:hypothetical protein [Paraliomyxa miuraensis]MCX4243570.1 DUF11 domain-containing protein [Paraliomyxa miuraensis]